VSCESGFEVTRPSLCLRMGKICGQNGLVKPMGADTKTAVWHAWTGQRGHHDASNRLSGLEHPGTCLVEELKQLWLRT